MRSKNFDDLKKVTHAIAGASASTGAQRLREIAKGIELDCIAGNCERALEHATNLPGVISMTEAAFRKHLAGIAGGPAADEKVSAA
jgi:HPt (histidine-containing phosphotransfer) domain-containing protein